MLLPPSLLLFTSHNTNSYASIPTEARGLCRCYCGQDVQWEPFIPAKAAALHAPKPEHPWLQQQHLSLHVSLCICSHAPIWAGEGEWPFPHFFAQLCQLGPQAPFLVCWLSEICYLSFARKPFSVRVRHSLDHVWEMRHPVPHTCISCTPQEFKH